jgi:CubicO group peptidase (beta-lactamase class C family)
VVANGPAYVHDVRSVSKSVVGLLYGIARAEGLVPPPETRLFDALPEHADLATEPAKRRIRIADVLAMRMGLAWSEGPNYDDPQNGEILMERAPDRYRYVLGLPVADRPGRRWVYCGGATALLGGLIERGTGLGLAAYARARLFEPLGLGAFEWIEASDGRAAASSGLRLTARDLARLGQLVLDRGAANGRQLVPPAWLAASLRPRGVAEGGLRYGYHWWLGKLAATGKPWAAAYGNGGQRLIVIPSLAMVVVILAGNYNREDQWQMPLKVMTRIVMPAVTDA